jgi:predicted enzyme related to lactoylglutathione lyase
MVGPRGRDARFFVELLRFRWRWTWVVVTLASPTNPSAQVTPDSDIAGAKRFYDAVFGWQTQTFDAGGNELTMWRLPGYVGGEPEQPVPRDVIAVMVPLPSPDVAPHWSVNFWVDDADAIAARTAELGGKVVVPPADAPGFREAVVADPEGATLSVSQRRP